ncbi:MAG: hypothetical protein R8L07_15860 [Alphaproteobacteria bacterium]|nr:hypothetical protein [Alphaproteobacteria bacterium]
MWTRSCNGFWEKPARPNRPFAALLLAATLLSPTLVLPDRAVLAQSQDETVDGMERPRFDVTEEFSASNIDPVTLAILNDALKSLQFFAIAQLEADEDIGLAQSGVVRGYLARRQKQDAIDNAERIEDPIWRARSYIWISDYVQVVEKNRDEARQWIDRAVQEVLALPEMRDEGESLQIAALRLAARRYPEAATRAAQSIPDTRTRVSTLQQVAGIALSLSESTKTRDETATILRATFDEAVALDMDPIAKSDILIEIGAVQLQAGDSEGAQASFRIAQQLILEVPGARKYEALTRLAAKMVEAGNQRGGMIVVRMIPEGADRARALAAVSAAMGRRNIDAAVPLFRLAMEETERIDDQQTRFDTLAFLVARQSEVGRLADAFEGAFLITEDVPRAEALLGMGRVLISQGKLAEALVLKEYIPYVGMRAQIMGPVALGRGLEQDPEGASALLAEALDPTGFPYIPEYVPAALDVVLTAQIRGGLKSADQAIFSRARDLAEVLPGDLPQVEALVQIAIAEARRGRIEDAQKTISAAYRIAFENKRTNGFDRALMAISLAQLAAGDLIGAYDTAARIPEPPPTGPFPRTPDGGFDVPRYQALIRVAAAAGRLGDPRFGGEIVTRKIAHAPAKATGLAAVAIAMANRTTDLIDVINDIRDGALLSPDFDYLNRVAQEAQEETGGDASGLGNAPQLAPLPQDG